MTSTEKKVKGNSLETTMSSEESPSELKGFKSDAELPMRASGTFEVHELVDEEKGTVSFGLMDELESDRADDLRHSHDALLILTDEERWKHKLMFEYKFKKTPKHLTWVEFGREIECLDCLIKPDAHRPEEIYSMSFTFCDKRTGNRDLIWRATNDISISEGLTDFLAAIGSCLGRADVHRTIRLDDGVGSYSEINIRKRSRYTSDILVGFRSPVHYNMYQRRTEEANWEDAMEKAGMSTWGFHPGLMDPEYRDVDNPEGTYHLAITSHALSFIVLRSIDRLLSRPLHEFYRPSQITRTVRVKYAEDLGIPHAALGWLGLDPLKYPHRTPIEAIQENWLGSDAPFSLAAIVNKLREMTYLKKRNPEFHSWLATRQHDTSRAIRNIKLKMLGTGASPLFTPLSHDATLNKMLPKDQQRSITTNVSIAGTIGMPDETRRIEELKSISESGKLLTTPTQDTGDSNKGKHSQKIE